MQTDRVMPKGISVLIGAACFVIVVAGMRSAGDILVPFFLSIFIAIIFTPPLFWMQKKGIPSLIAIFFIITCIIAIFYLLARFVGSSVNDFTNSLPLYRELLISKSAKLQQWLAGFGIKLSDEMLKNSFNPGTAMQMAARTLSGLSGALTNIFLILLTVIFILLEASGFPKKIRAGFKAPEKSIANFVKFTESVNQYVVLKTIFSLITGIFISGWLAFLGVDYALLWGLVAFLLNYVPNIGSIIAAIPAILMTLVQLGAWHTLLVAMGYVAVNIVIGSILEPKFMGEGLGLSTLVVFLSLVFWGWVLGPVGMLLSVPLTMISKIALESSEETRWVSVMLGGDPQES
ncbi:MAG: AI-2E family transporter [Dissulfuribacterales bacterium]